MCSIFNHFNRSALGVSIMRHDFQLFATYFCNYLGDDWFEDGTDERFAEQQEQGEIRNADCQSADDELPKDVYPMNCMGCGKSDEGGQCESNEDAPKIKVSGDFAKEGTYKEST